MHFYQFMENEGTTVFPWHILPKCTGEKFAAKFSGTPRQIFTNSEASCLLSKLGRFQII